MKDREILTGLIRKYSVPLVPLPPEPEILVNLRSRLPPFEPSAFKAVLFDIYGTLFVSGSGDIGLSAGPQAVNAGDEDRSDSLLAPYFKAKDLPRLRALFVEAVQKRHAELRSRHADPEIRVENIWQKILGIEEDAARKFSLSFELAVNPVFPMPGALQTLQALRRTGLPLGIVSNAQFFTPLLFEAFFDLSLPDLGFPEDLCVYSYREEEAKPSSRLFAKAADGLQRLGIAVHDGLYIGNDMLNDVWAAQDAGFKTALFAGDKRSLRLRGEDARCRDLRPDILIESLNEINHYIEG